MHALKNVQAQEGELPKLQAEVKRQEALMQEKLQQIQIEKELKIAAARTSPYSEDMMEDSSEFNSVACASLSANS